MGVRLDQNKLASSPEFAGIVRAALVSAAIAIRQESPTTPNHENRLVLCNTVFAEMGNPQSELIKTFQWLAAMNPTIRAKAVVAGSVVADNIADADVDFVVASHWDNIAGSE